VTGTANNHTGGLWRITAGIGFVLLVAGLLPYRSYILSLAWHSVHGPSAKFGQQEITLPLLWRELNADDYDTHVFARASSSDTFPDPEITIRPFQMSRMETDQHLLESLQRLISARNSHPVSGTSSSLVVLHSPSHTLFCEKSHSQLFGIDLTDHLMCETAGVPYALIFDGPPLYESEAEAVIRRLN
jgi:hypothetical protein